MKGRNIQLKVNHQGFTLIEVMIVTVILAILAGLVSVPVMNYLVSSKQKAAKTQMSMFETALETYKMDVGKFPTTEQGLEALMNAPSGVKRWRGPYLKKQVPQDPWGNPYVYICPGSNGDFDIISHGADGQPGGEKGDMDIFNWKPLE